ncbi:UDP-N-acetylmuramate dehydrogenase [Roseobacter weihaiensis]|uniref:UDP-N-acetylmuramate dehydrogenase n=1 Tax=Roseobacter weihaiensis TaxID=2763262 RepID=UPI001D0B3E8A|nr:UDP-N-acetylmuramate dehydrogenase [Roseobacter sp. H9]
MMKTSYFLDIDPRVCRVAAEFPNGFQMTCGERVEPSVYLDIYRRVGATWGWKSRLDWTLEEAANHLSRANVDVGILTCDTHEVGFYEYERNTSEISEIVYFGLVPKWIGKGLARAFLNAILDRAVDQGVTKVELKTASTDHSNALRFYRAAGFSLRTAIYCDEDISISRDFADNLPLCVRPLQSLLNMNWFATRAVAEYFGVPASIEELMEMLDWASRLDLSVRVLGEGANSLLPDNLAKGVVVRLTGHEFEKIDIGEAFVTCGAGASLSRTIAETIRNGLGGLEHFAGIPASIGGAIVGNAGGRKGGIGDIIDWVEIIDNDLQLRRIDQFGIKFTYRNSSLRDFVVIRARLALRPGPPHELRREYIRFLKEKKVTQPLKENSVGCIFKNPAGTSARTIIREVGLGGLRVGGAVVSPLHQNFVCAEFGATYEDILTLVKLVEEKVAIETGIRLEREVIIWGE